MTHKAENQWTASHVTAAVVLVTLLTICSVPVRGDPPADTGQRSGDLAEIAPEELSLRELRREVIRAEDEVYRVFNELNLDDEYDIICRREKSVSSHFSRRVCQARLFRENVEERAHDFPEQGVHEAATSANEYHTAILNQKMHNLSAAHPELRAALARHRELKQALDAR
ncbi:MAG: hypothetical protein GWM87_15880 [Xanthomonadales bacterium]|nr:hypothetical protein [Xanthomonadales bacterium]NIX14252.1 hypothetical protein [Xanthomonadales bacterium]